MSYIVHVMCLDCGGWSKINVEDDKPIYQRDDECDFGCSPTSWDYHSITSERTFNFELAAVKTRSRIRLMNRSANHKGGV